LGAWLGWQMLPLVIVLSSAVGAITGITLLVLGKTERQQAIPFGPFLAAAGWISLLWGNLILDSYLGLFKF
jgi:leader peptidase (prepilin peptidase)/N-methyltransferase